MKPKILIIEDDVILSKVITQTIEAWKYSVALEIDGQKGLERAQSNEFDLVITDIALPHVTGLTITDHIRENHLSVPVIIISNLDDFEHHDKSYELGANIFHPKPINFKPLLTQIKSLLKFSGHSGIIRHNNFIINLSKRILIYNNFTINLTPKEARMLQAFFKNPGYVFTREKLIYATFKGSKDKTYGSIDTLISRLRKRIILIDPKLDYDSLIETVYGVGYKIHNDS